MTQSTALIVHEIMDAPEHWTDGGDHITNGYYKVAFDGGYYTMGTARYSTSEADGESFRKALDMWKHDTGWKPKDPVHQVQAPDRGRKYTLTEHKAKAYEDFVHAARVSLKGFSVHGDSGILSGKIQEALTTLDGIIKPIGNAE